MDAIILDGAVAVQMMEPGATCTLGDNVDMVFQPFTLKQLESASRIDFVWVVYQKDSLEIATRGERDLVRDERYFRPLVSLQTGKVFYALMINRTKSSPYLLNKQLLCL